MLALSKPYIKGLNTFRDKDINMSETKIYLNDSVDRALREEAMARFGYGRGSISAAAEEAIVQWLRRNNAIKARLAAIIETARKDRNVMAVLLFGSYAKMAPDYDDIDIALLLIPKADPQHELSIYRDISSIPNGPQINFSILNTLPLDIQSRILNESKPLYVGEKSKLYDYSIKIAERWSDFKPKYLFMING